MRNLTRIAAAVLAVCCLAEVSSASIWGGYLAPGANTFEDQNREVIIDMDDDGAASVGDVILGYNRIDDRAVPPLSGGVEGIYAVFTTEITAISSVIAGPTTIYSVTLAPTAAGTAVGGVGLDLPSLVGPLPPLSSAVDSAVAVISGVTTDFINTAPGSTAAGVAGTLDIFDFIAGVVGEGTVDSIASIAQAGDFWSSTFLVPTAADPIGTLSLLSLIGIADSIGVNGFEAGLSIIDVASDPIFNDTVGILGISPPFFELTITNGGLSGAADIFFSGTNPFFFTLPDGGSGINAYGASSNADFSVNANVPEPMTLAVWSGLAVISGAVAVYRKRRQG